MSGEEEKGGETGRRGFFPLHPSPPPPPTPSPLRPMHTRTPAHTLVVDTPVSFPCKLFSGPFVHDVVCSPHPTCPPLPSLLAIIPFCPNDEHGHLSSLASVFRQLPLSHFQTKHRYVGDGLLCFRRLPKQRTVRDALQTCCRHAADSMMHQACSRHVFTLPVGAWADFLLPQ